MLGLPRKEVGHLKGMTLLFIKGSPCLLVCSLCMSSCVFLQCLLKLRIGEETNRSKCLLCSSSALNLTE